MPGELKNIIIDQSTISHMGENRTVKIIGDPGARFILTIKNAAGTSKLNSNAMGYISSLSHADVIMPSSGVYTFIQYFPTVTASDKYKIEIKKRLNTTLISGFNDYILLTQWYPTTLTLTLASADNASSYTSSGSNYGVTNVTITNPVIEEVAYTNVGKVNKSRSTSELSWEITGASGAGITISRQPIVTDFSNNIASVSGETSNTSIKVKALANADRGTIKISSADADKLTSSMVVKEYSKGEDLAKKITEAAEEAKVVVVKEVEVKVKELVKVKVKELVKVKVKELVKVKERSVIEEKTELEAGETTVKEVTVSAVDTTNNFITLSTSQSVRYGDVLEFTNGGTEVIFKDLKAVQLAPSVIKITANVQLISMGVQDVTSTLALDNFITV